ncbi:unnamed protein product [Coffea canephora]|uniref:Uncharacterized protein n=1 Tax=Coffea canephora TaxID=49390 RepID=A0A068V2P9_COFCA|nr:unnamed protein product [Coffea canephora]
MVDLDKIRGSNSMLQGERVPEKGIKRKNFEGKEAFETTKLIELLSGFSLLLQQINALLKKNFILAWRNRRSTFLQLFSSFFFIAFMFALRKTNKYTESRPNFCAKVRDTKPITNSPIPACEDKLIINVPCFDFVWSGSGNQRLESIVNGIMTNNPGRTIPQSKVKSFRTKDELDKWLLDNPMRCPGALHLFETNAKEIR